MLVDNGKYFVYRHVRKDNDKVFYIGIGKKKYRKDCMNPTYARSKNKKGRNFFWDLIVSKTDYDIDILYESDSREIIQEKEIEFIKLYGRRDLNLGSLCNLTNGGDNGLLRSAFSINKQLETAKKTGSYYTAIERLKKYAPKKGQVGGPSEKKTFLYDSNGIFFKQFNNRKESAAFFDIFPETLALYMRKGASYRGYFIFNEYLGDSTNVLYFKHTRPFKKKIIKICPSTGNTLELFDSITSAGDSVKKDKGQIWHAINRKWRCAGYYWKYNL